MIYTNVNFSKLLLFQTSENKKRNALRFLNYLSYILIKTVNLMYIIFIFECLFVFFSVEECCLELLRGVYGKDNACALFEDV